MRAWGRFRTTRPTPDLKSQDRRWRADRAELTPPARSRVFALATNPAGASKKKKLLFINQYYWPDHASTAQHLTDLAESMAEAGHEVHVLCSQGGYKPSRSRSASQEVRNGVTIHRVPATALGRRTTVRRMIDYLSFYLRALVLAVRLPRFDAVATLTTPPIIGLVGTLLRQLKGSHHIYWSMDLHPDASLALGLMSHSNPVVAALIWLSNFVYRQADSVVVLGAYMADRIASKGVRPERIVTIPVWSRSDEVYPLQREGHPLRRSMGLADTFVAMYSGNLGLAHSTDEFLEAARRLQDRSDIVFLFVGDGPRMAEVRAAKALERLENVQLLDYFPREQLHASLSLADVHLISMRQEMTGIVVPGKLYGVMAAGRPAIFVGPDHCETADTIRESDCGLTVRLGDAAGLVEAIETLAADPLRAKAMGERGRDAFLADHERETCCSRWDHLMTQLLTENKTATIAANRTVAQGF